jgi:hypothetical protein
VDRLIRRGHYGQPSMQGVDVVGSYAGVTVGRLIYAGSRRGRLICRGVIQGVDAVGSYAGGQPDLDFYM